LDVLKAAELLERAFGRFERSVQLPMPVQADEVKPKEIEIDIL
jgi:HSP20 family molecular chaperone IbpA